MPFFAPKFCQTHLKIHVCDEGEIRTKLNNQENKIASKVRRLHGVQTEEDKAIENAKRVKLQMSGSFNSILENAKKKNEEDKKQTSFVEENLVVKQEVINDRISRLRNASLNTETTPIAKKSPKTKDNSTTSSNIDINDDPIKSNSPINVLNSPIANIASPIDDLKKKSKNKQVESIKQKEVVEDETNEEKQYSGNELQKIVADAVKAALKEAGIIKNDKKKVNKNSTSPTKKTTSKSASKSVKKVVTKLKSKPVVKTVAKKVVVKSKLKPVAKKVETKKTVAKKPISKPIAKNNKAISKKVVNKKPIIKKATAKPVVKKNTLKKINKNKK